MSIGAAIRITSPDEERVIRHAAELAYQQGSPCYVISIVRELPHGDVVNRNLALIAELHTTPIIQEGDEVAKTLLLVAQSFGVRTLFLGSGRTPEQLLYLDPPFDVVVVGSE